MCQTKNFYLWLLQIVGLLGLLALCLWLSLRPRHPNYYIMDLSFPVSPNHNASSQLGGVNQEGTLTYILEIKNPNKDSSVYHDNILLMFYYGHDLLGNNSFPSFHQGRDKATQRMNHLDANINLQAWKALANAISNATAELTVDLLTRIRYNTWGVKSKHRGISLQGRIPIGSDGKIVGKKKKIKLRHKSRKWKLRTIGFH